MEYKLDFEWLSDPFLQYALYLSGLFFLGVLCCIIVIAYKFVSYRRHQANQNHAIELIKSVLKLNQNDSSVIHNLNNLIRNKPIDCCYALVRVFENRTEQISPKLLERINLQHIINRSLESLFHKNRAIAIEAIGLLKFQSYRSKILSNLEASQYCPFAAKALIRLDGKAGIPQILDCYQNQLLSISQTLTALMELDSVDLNRLHKTNSSIKIPNEFLRYLKMS